MKKIAFIVLLCCLTVLQSMAQEFHFIPKIGLNLANVTGMNDMGIRSGLNIGVSGEFMFTSRFALEPGIYYSMQGVKGDIMVNDNDRVEKGTLTWGADYLNIPIYAKWYTRLNGFYLFGGPQLSFKVKDINKIDIPGGEDLDDFDNGVSSYKTFDFGLAVGLGYQFNSGLLLSAGYTIGLIDIYKQEYGNTNLNSVFQFNAGWRF